MVTGSYNHAARHEWLGKDYGIGKGNSAIVRFQPARFKEDFITRVSHAHNRINGFAEYRAGVTLAAFQVKTVIDLQQIYFIIKNRASPLAASLYSLATA